MLSAHAHPEVMESDHDNVHKLCTWPLQTLAFSQVSCNTTLYLPTAGALIYLILTGFSNIMPEFKAAGLDRVTDTDWTGQSDRFYCLQQQSRSSPV